MAPPDSVSAACQTGEHGPNGNATYRKGNGCVEDYGHMDLLIGIRAEVEVFPHILNWLKDHDVKADLSSG